MTELNGRRIWVAGHSGMVGSALCRRLQQEDCEILVARRAEVDLRRQSEVERWMSTHRPDLIFVSAATVGGIHANQSRPAEFLYDNLMIEANIIHAAATCKVEKLLFLGSSCIYPRLAAQPMREDALLTGPLEPTNEWYAVAKIAGLKLCQAYQRQYAANFISAMPTNLYGINDNFDLEAAHVLPALMAKMHAAKVNRQSEVVVWGTGTPRRELLFVDDCADALVFLMRNYEGEGHVNVGTGEDLTIAELAEAVQAVVGYDGRLRYDICMPDGAPQKLLDVSKLAAMGWRAKTSLECGIRITYEWYQRQLAETASSDLRTGSKS